MVLGLHHVGRTVCDLERTVADLAAITGWDTTVDDGATDPFVAGRAVRETALAHGPNGWIELVAVDGTAGPRRAVNEPGLTHAAIQTGDIDAAVRRLDAGGVGRHPGPVDLGTGYRYLYVRDSEHLVTEIEGAPHAPPELDAWLAHGAFATADIDRLRDAYERFLGTTATNTVRVRRHPEFNRAADLDDVDVTVTWVPSTNAPVEMWQYHHPVTRPGAALPYEHPGSGHLAFESDDIDDDLDRALAAGFVIADEPQTNDGVEIARLRDPDHHWVELLRFDGRNDARSLRQRPDLGRVARMNARPRGER